MQNLLSFADYQSRERLYFNDFAVVCRSHSVSVCVFFSARIIICVEAFVRALLRDISVHIKYLVL